MDKSDICKFRVEELDRARESLRSVEWRTFFEMVTGYVALVVAFAKVEAQTGKSWLLFSSGVFAAIIVSFAGCMVLHGAHVRMKFVKDGRDAYIDKLHELTETPDLEDRAISFWRYWAILPQYAILGTTAVGVISWMLWSTMSSK